MEAYKKASKVKLRIPTSKGFLSVETLWDLKEPDLIDLEDQYTQLVEKGKTTASSRRARTIKTKDQLNNELILEILTDILDTKERDNEIALKAKDTKEKNQKILELIEKKKDHKLEEMSVEELEAMLVK